MKTKQYANIYNFWYINTIMLHIKLLVFLHCWERIYRLSHTISGVSQTKTGSIQVHLLSNRMYNNMMKDDHNHTFIDSRGTVSWSSYNWEHAQMNNKKIMKKEHLPLMSQEWNMIYHHIGRNSSIVTIINVTCNKTTQSFEPIN